MCIVTPVIDFMGSIYSVSHMMSALLIQLNPSAKDEVELIKTEPQGNAAQSMSHFICVSTPSGPINREMRHLISSLQNHNLQLKGDVQRYKRKLRETQMEINKVYDLIQINLECSVLH